MRIRSDLYIRNFDVSLTVGSITLMNKKSSCVWSDTYDPYVTSLLCGGQNPTKNSTSSAEGIIFKLYIQQKTENSIPAPLNLSARRKTVINNPVDEDELRDIFLAMPFGLNWGMQIIWLIV